MGAIPVRNVSEELLTMAQKNRAEKLNYETSQHVENNLGQFPVSRILHLEREAKDFGNAEICNKSRMPLINNQCYL